ncbi:MAG: YcxB family protein [Lachnospiraceae bacterium]|nr:YcxB family protein [Lachnospiraceae bacterium]
MKTEAQYTYKYRVKTSDLWQASMYYSYSSFLGVVNVVCIIAAIVLIVSKWSDSSDIFRSVMAVFLLMFTVIQPFVIWLRARASLNGVFPELELTFSQAGVTIESEGQRQHKPWQAVVGIVKKPTILVVYMEGGAGYILRNSVLKETKNELYGFVSGMLEKYKAKQVS